MYAKVCVRTHTRLSAGWFKEMCYSFYIIRKGLWSPNAWNLSLYSRSIGQVYLSLSSDLLCCCPHVWLDTCGQNKACSRTTISRLCLLLWSLEEALWLSQRDFTWLTNPIKHTIKLQSSELKLGPSPCHLAWEMNRGQPFIFPHFEVCLHVNTLRPSFISVLTYFKQRRPNDNNMDVYVPITHSAAFPSWLGLSKKKKTTKIFRYSGNPSYASSIPFPFFFP